MRDGYFARVGIRVLRFANHQVRDDLISLLGIIAQAVKDPTPNPFPAGAGKGKFKFAPSRPIPLGPPSRTGRGKSERVSRRPIPLAPLPARDGKEHQTPDSLNDMRRFRMLPKLLFQNRDPL